MPHAQITCAALHVCDFFLCVHHAFAVRGKGDQQQRRQQEQQAVGDKAAAGSGGARRAAAAGGGAGGGPTSSSDQQQGGKDDAARGLVTPKVCAKARSANIRASRFVA